jgi:hypothetical protein
VVINAVPNAPTAPAVGTITQPTCSAPTGSVVLSGLPASGTWTLTRTPGGSTTGTGTSTTIANLAPGSYTFTVTNALGCISPSSANVVINAVPNAPTAPVVGTITQPTNSVPTGSVVLNGLPASGTWTLTMNPGSIKTTGSGITTTISDLAPGNYTFTITNALGCTSPISASVVINAVPSELTAKHVTGGGYIVLTNASSGKYKGASGSKMDFGLAVVNNENGRKWFDWFNWFNHHKGLKGNVNIVYNGTDGNIYHIDSDEINSLEITEIEDASGAYYIATITAKADLLKLSHHKKTAKIGENLTLIVKVWDCTNAKSGKYDRIGVQLSGNDGSDIYFSSNWSNDIGNTIEQILDGGNIYIDIDKNPKSKKASDDLNADIDENTNYMKKSENINVVIDKNSEDIKGSEFGITTYPNPFTDHVYFDLKLRTDSKVRLEIYDINGSKISTLYDDVVIALDSYRFEYTPENLKTGTLIYRLLVNGKIMFTGKLIRN